VTGRKENKAFSDRKMEGGADRVVKGRRENGALRSIRHRKEKERSFQ
jgi:hypothetical protein